jgi:hypothetical protein
MTGPKRTRAAACPPAWRATLLTCVLALAFALAATAVPAAADVHYVKEDEHAYQQQLAAGQIASATINKRIRTIRLTLKDGSRFLARYPAHEEPRVAAELKAKHVAVSVLKPSEAKSEEKKSSKAHKILGVRRLYAAIGGGVILIVVVVGGLLLIDRRRKTLAE